MNALMDMAAASGRRLQERAYREYTGELERAANVGLEHQQQSRRGQSLHDLREAGVGLNIKRKGESDG